MKIPPLADKLYRLLMTRKSNKSRKLHFLRDKSDKSELCTSQCKTTARQPQLFDRVMWQDWPLTKRRLRRSNELKIVHGRLLCYVFTENRQTVKCTAFSAAVFHRPDYVPATHQGISLPMKMIIALLWGCEYEGWGIVLHLNSVYCVVRSVVSGCGQNEYSWYRMQN